MIRKKDIEEIKSRYAELLQPAKKRGTFICECGNGTGSDGDGIVVGTKNPNHLECFRCGFSGDIIQYYRDKRGLSFSDALRQCASDLHFILDESTENATHSPKNTPQSVATSNYTLKTTDDHTTPTESETNYSDFFSTCLDNISITGNKGIEYMNSRGISLETCKKFNVGYCEAWKTVNAPANAPTTERIIIPNSENSYLARAIDSNIEKKYQKMKQGKQRIFNYNLLNEDNSVIFIVEGEIDAMSVYEVGADAIALGSAGNVERLLNFIDETPKAKYKTFVICGDNDANGTGQNASKDLEKGLKDRKIDCFIADINGIYKDANEHLQHNKTEFSDIVNKTLKKALEPFENDLMLNNIDKLIDLFSKPDNKAISTGFRQLDEKLNGGIHRGELTLIGASPSLGKTTFTMQIVENIAQTTDEEIIKTDPKKLCEATEKKIKPKEENKKRRKRRKIQKEILEEKEDDIKKDNFNVFI